MTKRAVIMGATGYSGGELCSLLSRHRGAEMAGLFSSPGGQGCAFASLHPSLAGRKGPDVIPFSIEKVLAMKPDVAFLATPNETSAHLAGDLLAAGIAVIDLSGAFRLKDRAAYPKWYGFEHPSPKLLEGAVYGLTEWCGDALVGARLVANPGCYATSVLLALKPLAGQLAPDRPIVCDSKSGVSGGGKRSELDWSFAEVSGNFKAYGAGTHRHEPEIRAALGLGDESELSFVPHLLPVVRGILSTLYVSFARAVEAPELFERLHGAYRNAPLVRVRQAGELPELKNVVGTPRAEIGFVLLSGGRRAVIVSVLDNLLKGAASQAVQNFNGMFDLDAMEGIA